MNSVYTAVVAGATFGLTTSPITTTQLVRYAGASDDYNRIHYDVPYAVEAGLGGIIAHGMLTMGFIGRALTDWAGPRGNVKHLDARFTAPVRPGDTVTVTGTVVNKTSIGGVGQAKCSMQARVGEKTVATGEAVVVWPL